MHMCASCVRDVEDFETFCWYCEEEFMASQSVIPGVKPVAQYEVPYQFVYNGKKRSASVIVQADSPDGAIVQARIVLKGTGFVKFGKPYEFLSESL